MKQLSILLLTTFLFISCASKKPTTKVAEVVEEKISNILKTYTISKGTIHWTGAKIAYDHKGTIDITAGTFSVDENKITGGDFVIDMTSITNTDLPANRKTKLEGHLKSADFFDVEKFPNAAFSITSVKVIETETANFSMTGNLTMKGITKSVTFPVLVVPKADGTLAAISDKFSINRSEWGIEYGTSLAGAVGDAIISDKVTLQIDITAK